MKCKLFSLSLLLSLLSFSQERSDGIYGEVYERNCPYKKIRLINTETKLCTFDKPVIPIDEIIWMSKPMLDKHNSKVMAIMLSAEGTKKLAAISKVYTGKNLVFVINNEAISIMKIDGVINNGKIILNEDLGNPTLEYVYKKIKKKNRL